MRKSKATPWDDRTAEDRAEQGRALSEEMSRALRKPERRAVWTSRTSGAKFVFDDPEDVGRRLLWSRIRGSGGEPGGWTVERHPQGSTVTVVVEPDFGPDAEEVEAWNLGRDELLCRAPDGQLVEPTRALHYHFDHAGSFRTEDVIRAEEVVRKVGHVRDDARQQRAEVATRERLEATVRARLEARRQLRAEVADGLLLGLVGDIDDVLDGL